MRLFRADNENREPSAIGRLLRRIRQSASFDRWTSTRVTSAFPKAQGSASVMIPPSGGGAPPADRTPTEIARKNGAWLDELSAALPNYEILMELGSGGQGVVYEAVHLPAQRRVAIKILRDGPIASRQQLERFRREIELVGRLRHPNIVNLYEVGEALGRPYFVMEHIEGWPVDEYAVLHRPSVRAVIEWFEKVCLAVSHAHQHGVIHRDLKSSNILIDESSEPRVVDFGLAKDMGNCGEHTAAGQVLGTLPYLAPEQVTGGAGDADVRTDVYAIAVSLFKTLTHRFPYSLGGSTKETIDAIVGATPMRLRRAMVEELRPEFRRLQGVNEDLECILQKALAKEKERRYASADAFAADLRAYLDGRAVAARAGHNWYQLHKTIRRYRVPIGVAAVVAIISTAGIYTSAASWRREAQTLKKAQSAMQAAGFVRLGQVSRDAGRVDDAERLFRDAIEMSEGATSTDREFHRPLFASHHALAELAIDAGDLKAADVHLQAAKRIADESFELAPLDTDRSRELAFVARLAGRLLAARGDYAGALVQLRTAEEIYRDCTESASCTDRDRFDLALLLTKKGQCQRKAGEKDAAFASLDEALGLLAALYESDSAVLVYGLELSKVEAEKATSHAIRKSAADVNAAVALLSSARQRLIAIEAAPGGVSLHRDVDRLLSAIETNLAKLQAVASRDKGH